MIHSFIPAGRAPYRPSLRAGSVVRVSRFEGARCTNTYGTTRTPIIASTSPVHSLSLFRYFFFLLKLGCGKERETFFISTQEKKIWCVFSLLLAMVLFCEIFLGEEGNLEEGDWVNERL